MNDNLFEEEETIFTEFTEKIQELRLEDEIINTLKFLHQSNKNYSDTLIELEKYSREIFDEYFGDNNLHKANMFFHYLIEVFLSQSEQ